MRSSYFLLQFFTGLKTENREVRARGSVAERGYRAVMSENERLCNKLEHLEEIFVHQARPGGFGKGNVFKKIGKKLFSSIVLSHL